MAVDTKTRKIVPPTPCKLIVIEKDLAIEAPPSRVFDALTRDIAAWWGPPYLFSDAAKDIVIEPQVGGRFYEDWGNGDGWLWATVCGIKRPERIELSGPLAMTGAIHGLVSIRLRARGNATTIKLIHRALGEIDEETRKEHSLGWQDLLERRLKAFVESGKRSGIGEAAAPRPATD